MYHNYILSDGRQLLSPNDLSYALDQSLRISLEKIRPADMKRVSIIADPELAFYCTVAMDSEKWAMPEYAMQHRTDSDVSFYRHYAILQDGHVYVNEGGYVPLEQILKECSEEVKNLILTNIATQAALAQLSLAVIEQKQNSAYSSAQ